MSVADRFAVYRFYDAEGTLLYVGMSKRLGHRRTEHKKRSAWYGNVSREAIEWFSDIEAAGAEEQRAIAAEKPKYNVMQPPWNVVPARPRSAPSVVDAALGIAADNHHAALAERDGARARLHAAILAELSAGTKQADIVRVTGYTRERVRQIARDQ